MSFKALDVCGVIGLFLLMLLIGFIAFVTQSAWSVAGLFVIGIYLKEFPWSLYFVYNDDDDPEQEDIPEDEDLEGVSADARETERPSGNNVLPLRKTGTE